MSSFLYCTESTSLSGAQLGVSHGRNNDVLQPEDYRTSLPGLPSQSGTIEDNPASLWPRCTMLGADYANIAPIWDNLPQYWESTFPPLGHRSPVKYQGVTRDNVGNPLGNVTVTMYNRGSNLAVDSVVSDANGVFTLNEPNNADSYIVGYKQGSPDTTGASLNTLGPSNLQQILTTLSLTTGLKFALDAGDIDSYKTGNTKWLDLSGNGQDFFLGIDSTPQYDPLFVGYPGRRSSEEHFYQPGLFTYDSANETWMNNMHKDSALFSLLIWYKVAGSVTNGLMGTNAGSTANRGIRFFFDTSSGVQFAATTGSGNALSYTWLPTNSSITPFGSWQCIGFSINEASGTNNAIMFSNGDSNTSSRTYTTPSASDATYTLEIGGVGNKTSIGTGNKIAMAAAWDGVALTVANFQSIFDATKTRYGVN